MKIAMLGTRGIPASYSGFETCVEQLGLRLVQRGHDVSVYVRSHHTDYSGSHYLGMRIIRLPTVRNKYLETIIHTLLSSLHSLWQRYDVALYFIVGNSPVTWIPRMVGTKTAINVDGLDWEREKWPPLAKKYLRFAEFLSTNMPNSYITDSGAVQAYYRERFGGNPIYIAYGSEVEHVEPGETLARFGLEPGKYVLFVGRLVPENCVHHLVQAFRQLRTNLNCVIVGDASYAESYKKSLLEQAKEDPRIIFTGYVFGNGYRELGSNAHIFVEPSAVGGTHPALLEAMAFGNCVVVNDSKGNLETIEAAGFSYDGQDGPESLKAILDQLLSDPELVNSYRTRARQRAASTFSWDSVTDDYERLFYKLLEEPAPARLQ